VVACCNGLPQELGLTVDVLRAHCVQRYIATPFSAQGWTELVYLACVRLGGGQRLLLSLDGITRMQHNEWGPFFTSIRAIHQAARSPNNRPEYRRLGMTLSGAFVPGELITAENSPFNVSMPLYLLPVGMEKLAQMRALLAAQGITLEEDALQALYRWSGGAPHYVQRFCAEIAQLGSPTVTAAEIAEIADAISANDAYPLYAMQRLEEQPELARYARRLLDKPLRLNRTLAPIAALEVLGVIRYDGDSKCWQIANGLHEQALRQHFIAVDDAAPPPPLPGDEAAVVGRALDWLFDFVGAILQERRDMRALMGEGDDTPQLLPGVQPTTKTEAQAWPLPHATAEAIDEIVATLALVTQFRKNIRRQGPAIALHGGIASAPLAAQNVYLDQFDQFKANAQRLKALVEQVFGRKIALGGLE
jgi:hypothetical protein